MGYQQCYPDFLGVSGSDFTQQDHTLCVLLMLLYFFSYQLRVTMQTKLSLQEAISVYLILLDRTVFSSCPCCAHLSV